MTMLGMIDYGLIVLFFIGVTRLILVIAYAPAHETAPQAVPPPQKAKETYAFLAVLFILLIMLAFFVWRGRSPAASM
jgi:accessory gene regulator protein AgrB